MLTEKDEIARPFGFAHDGTRVEVGALLFFASSYRVIGVSMRKLSQVWHFFGITGAE